MENILHKERYNGGIMKSINNVNNNSAVMKKTIKRPGISIRIKEPGSAITHFIAAILTLVGTSPLMMRAHQNNADNMSAIALIVFCTSMFLLYMSSTILHTFDISPSVNEMLQKLDHAMIYVLIAGSYTPVCLIPLRGKTGYTLLAIVWTIAILGIIFKLIWIKCPKWLGSSIYIALGWACLGAFPAILKALTTVEFAWLLAGGIIYTIGGVIYALKLSIFNKKHKFFGSHEIFHLFVMAGSFCHFVVMFYLA